MTAKAQIELSVVGSGVQQSRQIANSVKNDLKSIGESAGRAEVSLGKAGSALKAFGSGAGLGTGMSLLGLSGVIGFAATAGAIMAQSFKLAAEFERISQRSVFSMTYNTGAIASNLEAFKRRANGMSDLGINAIDAARMGASYGSASGRNPVYAMRSLGEWARSYGVQDLNAFGGQMGMISQYAGGDVNKNAAAFFGGASQAGDLGKRQGDIMGQLVNVLSSMNSSNPTGTASVRDAMREIVGVTSMGGFYQSTYGAGVTLSAEQKLGSGMLGDAYKTRMAMAAGLPLSAIINGTTNPVHLQAMAQQAYKWSHGNANMLSLNLAAAGFSEEQRRALAPLIMAKHGNILASDIKDADKRIGAYQGTKTGQLEQTMASLTNSEIHLGEGLMNSILPALKDLAQKIEGMSKSLDKMDFSKQVLGLEQHLDTLAAVLIATSIARGAVGLLKGGGMGFLRGLLARVAGGAAVEGAEGAAVGAAGALAAPLAIGASALAATVGGWAYLAHVSSRGPTMDEVRMAQAMPGDYATNIQIAMAQNRGHFGRGDLLAHSKFAYVANSGDFASGAYTSNSLINGLEWARMGHDLTYTAINRGHHADGSRGHSGGYAADVGVLDGITIGKSFDPRVKAFLLQQIQTNPWLRQLGVPDVYMGDSDLRSAAASRKGLYYFDEHANNHVHLGMGDRSSETQVPGGKIVSTVKVQHKFVPGSNRRSGGHSRSHYK